MGVFDCKNMGVLAELGKCTQNGAESDFVGMFDKLSHINGYMNPMGRGSLASSFEGLAEEVMITDLIAEFARKYPERFRRCDPAVIQRYIRAPLIREIIKGTETAYLLADMVLGSVDNNNSNNYVLFYEILQTAVLCGNYRFFDYCAANIESPSSKVESEFLYYLCEHKQYDSLDKLLGNTTREELLEYCRPKPNLYGVDCNMEHKLSCLYELCTRYLPEVTNSDDVPAAVSEFLDEADISEYLNMHTDFSSAGRIRAMPIFENAWSFMKEHGLRFLSINGLAMSYCGYGNKDTLGKERIIKEELMPLFADELYLDVLSASALQGNDQQGFARVLRLIGPERVYLDLTDRHIERSFNTHYIRTEDVVGLYIKQLLTVDMKVRVDDDIAHSKIANALIGSAYLLEYVLDRTEVSVEQLMLLMDKCIKKKCFDSLNVIRRHLDR